MNNDILCPECGHSMAFHGWYGGCECPINGVNKRCRCTQTHYSQYSILRKQLEDVKDVALRVLNKLNKMITQIIKIQLNKQSFLCDFII